MIMYSFFLIVFSILSLPYFLIKGKLHKGIFFRFYFNRRNFPVNSNKQKTIWLHGASVGEIQAVKALTDELRILYPDVRLVFSTITETGNILARKFAALGDKAIFFPFDLRFIVREFLDAIKPDAFILLETEIWPNFLMECNARNIPVILINGRISDRAFKRYLLVKPLLKNVLDKIDILCMQDEENKAKIIRLGAPQERVFVTGNIKFDISINEALRTERFNLLKEYLNLNKRFFLIAGSTHPKEETRLFRALKVLKSECPSLLVLVAPRHVKRAKSVKKEAVYFGFRSEFYSNLNSQLLDSTDVIILDVIGELKYLYELASVVFIGGSLIPHGGHNPIEAAYFSKPILFGPHMYNFREISSIFLNMNAAISVTDEEALLSALRRLSQDSQMVKAFGENAINTVKQNKGVSVRTLNLIKPYLRL